MRKVVGILGICIAASVVWGNLLAQTPETTPETKPDTEAQPDEHAAPQIAEEVRQRLHEPITLKLDAVPLEDALAEILRKRNFEYWFDHEKIKEESVRLETIEVTCDLKNVSIRAALKRILGQAHLGWVCDDSGIQITTKTEQMSTCFARIYDVGDLLESPKVEVTGPGMPHQEIQFGGNRAGEATKPEEKKPDSAKPADAIPNMICSTPAAAPSNGGPTIDPTPEGKLMLMIQTATGGPSQAPWMYADGEGGTVNLIQTSHAKLLVIRQNELCHAEIEHLLNELISHQHSGEEEAAAAPAEKNASRNIVRPRVRIVAKRKAR
ncbi:MAG: hypothetical protein JWN70_1884 [Planctomycetaceae bacterium]|nr:hypothetical protein [Planctomycetaceae bacterium]